LPKNLQIDLRKDFSLPPEFGVKSTIPFPDSTKCEPPINWRTPADLSELSPRREYWLSYPLSRDSIPLGDVATPPQVDPPANTHCSLCWTGKELLMWGGSLDQGVLEEFSPNYFEERLLNIPFAYDPQRAKWKALPSINHPPNTLTHCLTVWTGKEMIVWKKIGFAYDPKNGHWRKLPPCRVGDAAEKPADKDFRQN
jgi:hypothetical protein